MDFANAVVVRLRPSVGEIRHGDAGDGCEQDGDDSSFTPPRLRPKGGDTGRGCSARLTAL